MSSAASSSHTSENQLPPLATLHTDLLSAITDFISLYDIANMVLCGNHALNRTLRFHGGLKRVQHENYNFYRFPHLLYSFRTLETIHMFAPLDFFLYNGCIDHQGEKVPQIWPNLRNLSLRAVNPFVPTNCPLNLLLCCPNLRHFSYTLDQWSLDDFTWPSHLESLHIELRNFTHKHAILDVPDSLTSLKINSLVSFKRVPSNLCEISALAASSSPVWQQLVDSSFLGKEISPHSGLASIGIDSTGMDPKLLIQVLESHTLTSITFRGENRIFDIPFAWPLGLKTLCLQGRCPFSDSFFFSLPQGLTRLTLEGQLQVRSKDCYESLPPTLTELIIRDRFKSTEKDFHAFLDHARHLPLTRLQWTGMEYWLCDEVVSKLPHTLRVIDGTQRRPISMALMYPDHHMLNFGPTCVLPSSLTALYMPDFNTEFKASMAAQLPHNLKIFHIRSPQLLRVEAIEKLPHSITELHILDEAVVNSGHIAVLPPFLKNFRTIFGKSLRLESLQLLPASLSTAIFPNLLRFGLQALDNLPRGITHLRIPGSLYKLTSIVALSKLPPNLLRLDMAFEDLTPEICQALPKSLTHLRTASKVANLNPKALAAALPRLTALEVPNHSSPHFRLGPSLVHLHYLDWKSPFRWTWKLGEIPDEYVT